MDVAGQRFALREGGRTVGAGVVSKVMGWWGVHLHIEAVCGVLTYIDEIVGLEIVWFFDKEKIIISKRCTGFDYILSFHYSGFVYHIISN